MLISPLVELIFSLHFFRVRVDLFGKGRVHLLIPANQIVMTEETAYVLRSMSMLCLLAATPPN
jgi:hypothetical protein